MHGEMSVCFVCKCGVQRFYWTDSPFVRDTQNFMEENEAMGHLPQHIGHLSCIWDKKVDLYRVTAG